MAANMTCIAPRSGIRCAAELGLGTQAAAAAEERRRTCICHRITHTPWEAALNWEAAAEAHTTHQTEPLGSVFRQGLALALQPAMHLWALAARYCVLVRQPHMGQAFPQRGQNTQLRMDYLQLFWGR